MNWVHYNSIKIKRANKKLYMLEFQVLNENIFHPKNFWRKNKIKV